MPNYIEYHKSIAKELIAIKDRVRNFIDDHHWAEDGRYKEILLINHLKKVLPASVSVGTGFVMCKNKQLSSQIDIIVYENRYPLLFSQNDFIIATQDSIVGIIEVKTKLDRQNIEDAMLKSHRNGTLIDNRIFNGIFSYERGFNFNNNQLPDFIGDLLKKSEGFINHICFDQNTFMKYWPDGNPQDRQNDDRRCFSFYDIPNLAYGYFISNLIYAVLERTKMIGHDILIEDYLFPIEEGKEARRINRFEIKLQDGVGVK